MRATAIVWYFLVALAFSLLIGWAAIAAPDRPSRPAAPVLSAGQNQPLVGQNQPTADTLMGQQRNASIAVNPTDPTQLVAAGASSFRDPSCPISGSASVLSRGSIALYVSSDGGQTWNYSCAPWPALGALPDGSYFPSDPSVVWDTSGNAYAAYRLVFTTPFVAIGSALLVAKRAAGTTTWTTLGIPVNHLSIQGPLDGTGMMTIDTTSGLPHSGRKYLIWQEYVDQSLTNTTLLVASSDDGASWNTAILDSAQPNTFHGGGCLTVGHDGTVYAVWNRESLDATTAVPVAEATVFASSQDGGGTWSVPVPIVSHRLLSFARVPAQDKGGISSFPSIAVDRRAGSSTPGRIYLGYSDFPPGVTAGANANIYEIHSSDKGASWSPPVLVNDDAGAHTHFLPWLTVDQSDSSVQLVWYDTRNDPIDRKAEVFFARSATGGASFDENLLVTDQGASFNNHVGFLDENSQDNTVAQFPQYGEYIGLAALGGRAHPLWIDSREFFPVMGDPNVGEHLATATLAPAPPPPPPPPSICHRGRNCESNCLANCTGDGCDLDCFCCCHPGPPIPQVCRF